MDIGSTEKSDSLPGNFFAELDARDAALWIDGCPDVFAEAPVEDLKAFLGLPWAMIINDCNAPRMFDALSTISSTDDPLVQKRGFGQIIDSDPSRIELPDRCLPIYILDSDHKEGKSDFHSQVRRINILEQLRRSGVRSLLILSDSNKSIPEDLTELWKANFKCILYVIATDPSYYSIVEQWRQNFANDQRILLLKQQPLEAINYVSSIYRERFPLDKKHLRIKDKDGTFRTLDITTLDDPERPILDEYEIIDESALVNLPAEQLSKEDFFKFFEDCTASWRPYAAGLPWISDRQPLNRVSSILRELDILGADNNKIAYILSEPGAGGTTLVRYIAWECARQGYPTLVAQQVPFIPEALSVGNFLNRVKDTHDAEILRVTDISGQEEGDVPVYETPWLIVFDRMHWQHRDTELRRFCKDLAKKGRPVCILVVSGPYKEIAYFDDEMFTEIAQVDHVIDQQETRALGRHLNHFLKLHGLEKDQHQWDTFYENHTLEQLHGVAIFWVALSFWIRGQFNWDQSIQDWVYSHFAALVDQKDVAQAVLDVSAMGSVGLPLPERLLPESGSGWPMSQLLDDERPRLGILGLTRVSARGERYWALIHDVIGRLILNAVFYDYKTRETLELTDSDDAEHLRFYILRRISSKKQLAEREFREIGEEFATSIFKIDPESGYSHFAPYWQEVLEALDSMPRPLQDNSRVFRHHVAISRRRISYMDSKTYGPTLQQRKHLLEAAISDIEYALYSIEFHPGTEPNLNLYNSLARAYLDLGEVERDLGAQEERIRSLQASANEATKRAYRENPSNSYVIETYVHNLLTEARSDAEEGIEKCVEALNILYSALGVKRGEYRRSMLSKLADRAVEILFEKRPTREVSKDPRDATDVLVGAWIKLTSGECGKGLRDIEDLPNEGIDSAIEILEHPAGHGNVQVMSLMYDLLSVRVPFDSRRQLEYLEGIAALGGSIAPQYRLEYAILLFQVGRPVEGDKRFRALRRLWKETENYVIVPRHLKWLRDPEARSVRTVSATTGSDRGHRAGAVVKEFQSIEVPFRPEEFNIKELRPGLRITCHVSFGHNGPFLRPTTAGPQSG